MIPQQCISSRPQCQFHLFALEKNMKLSLFICGMLLSAPLMATSEIKDIPAHSGGMQRLLLLKPERPTAVLVIFAGGDRALGIRADGSLEWGGASLLLRTSPLFVQRGFTVAIVDMPSDRLAKPIGNFRESAVHAQDIAAVIDFLRRDSKLPVWLMGTSSGTTSVLNAAIRLQKNGADGIVLATGLDAGSSMQLDAIRVPTLVVRKGDPCRPVPQSDAAEIMSAFTNAPKAEELTVQSIVEKGADPCQIVPVHGYLGLENQFVDKISDWIKALLRQQNFI